MRIHLQNLALLTAAAALVGLTGCSDNGGGTTPLPDGGGDTSTGDDGSVTGPCTAPAGKNLVVVDSDITSSETWTSDNLYCLTTQVFVHSGTLTIQPGTEIQGTVDGALLIMRDAKIDAQGTASDPIVFTSNQPAGSRAPSDWQGLVLMGYGQINNGNKECDSMGNNCKAHIIEGIEETDDRGLYGGDDDTDDCGTLEYVRIEFAGHELMPNVELNGLTLGACGSGTELDYVQIHMGSDDDIECFGGMPHLRHFVLTPNQDDSLDLDNGFRGFVQYVAILQGAQGDHGFEMDSNGDALASTPRSDPKIFNVTSVGGGAGTNTGSMLLRENLKGSFGNMIVMNAGAWGIDIADYPASPTYPQITNSLFYNEGDGGDVWVYDSDFCIPSCGGDATCEADCDNDSGFDESAYYMMGMYNNLFGTDPMLADPANASGPDWTPTGGYDVTTNAMDPSTVDPWFEAAQYMGAFDPAGSDWTAGWTSYPAN